MKKRFGNNLKKYRTLMNITQGTLAEKIGYTGKAISKWESGRALPPSELLPMLAAALNTDINSLFEYHGDPLYYLGIDGGGTKTRFILQKSTGEIINNLTLEACNPTSIGIDKCIEVLKRGITNICNGKIYGEISVFCGMAGAGVTDIRDKIINALTSFGFASFKVDSDICNIISIGLRGREGVVAIVGTGSVVFAVTNKKRYQIGGYGHLLGDALSGSELGRLALNVAFSDLDGSGENSAITQKVIQKLGKTPSDAVADIYTKDKSYMASFACCLLEAARDGDKVAINLLQDNICKFNKQIETALKYCPEGSSVVVAGGIITNYPELAQKMTRKIEIMYKDPVYGALLLAGGRINE